MAYIQGNSVPHANLEVLDKLAAARHELAQVVISFWSVWNHVWCNQALIIYTSGCIWKVILSIWFSYSGIYVKTLDLLSWRSHPSKIGLFLQSFYVQCEPQIGHGIKASWGCILSSEFCVSNQHAFCFTKNGDTLAIKTLEIYVIVLNFDVNPAVQN